MEYNSIKISTNEAEKILADNFNITGKASQLPGEIDFNFKIKVANKNTYILKISRPNESLSYLEYQQDLLLHLKDSELETPIVFLDKNDNTITTIKDGFNETRYVRLLSWIEGRLWSNVNPKLDDLRENLGKSAGELTNALLNFDHKEAHRNFEWDVAQGLWTQDFVHLFSKEEQNIITYFQEKFIQNQKSYNTLKKSVVHNDANDNNVIVSDDLITPKVKSIIDFGDAIYTQTINDLAITCAYAIMHYNDPLQASVSIIKGYNNQYKITDNELKHLYTLIAMRLIISVTKSAINKQKEPDNKYLLISEKPAWELLKKWYKISEKYAYFQFRLACNFTAHPNELDFKNWTKTQQIKFTDLFPSIKKQKIHLLDLSVSSNWIGNKSDFNNIDYFEYKLNQLQKQHPSKLIAGGYTEARPIYTSSEYDIVGNFGRESRTIHLGIDFWLPEKTPVHAIFKGEIITSFFDNNDKEYGGLIILKHNENNISFYTLYGHLSKETIDNSSVGKKINKGECIGYLGNKSENGNWAPHLHFQIMLSVLSFKNDFPGVALPSKIDLWSSICPDPNLLFKSEELKTISKNSNEDIIDFRKQFLGKSLSLQYKKPLKIVRGDGVYLIDDKGNKYLDTVNNVAHVGHENSKVVNAGKQQMSLLNTNSRYLHDAIVDFSKELLETLPPELSVLHFVNSGSEANELAIRMVKAHTKQKDIIASEIGYHGNSNMCIDISSYKFDGNGGNGAPEHTHIIPLPDTFRGKYTDDNASELYANEVLKQIQNIEKKGRKVGGFIIEPIISCGGQVELPENFLSKAYEYVRNAGGICISDEVQTGCGRLGKTFWGFQLHNVTPDIVTIGKPIGNGHPLAVVACTQEVAESFANGMEYFNTFGGNPVSCTIGKTVLQTVKEDKLQENALTVGNYLKEQLNNLSKEFPIIGNVRGQGLFLGFELVNNAKEPLPNKANYLANRMKSFKILMSTDGKDNNVLKIKPPIVFSIENAKELIFYLRKVFNEDFMKL